MHKSFVDRPKSPAGVYLYTARQFADLGDDPFPGARNIAAAHGFTGAAGQLVIVPGEGGKIASVLFGLGAGRDALAAAALSARLPEGDYEIAADGGQPFEHIAAAWADGAYRFTRYKAEKAGPPRLGVPSGKEGERVSREADAVAHLRDMVNTPAADMPPAGLQMEIEKLAELFGANVTAVIGDDLLAQNYPMVHAVGRAATEAPRFLELEWGEASNPGIALVGKG